jgi:hypothetical protein
MVYVFRRMLYHPVVSLYNQSRAMCVYWKLEKLCKYCNSVLPLSVNCMIMHDETVVTLCVVQLKWYWIPWDCRFSQWWILRDVMLYIMVHRYQHFGETCCLSPISWRWMWQVPSKCWYLSFQAAWCHILQDCNLSNGYCLWDMKESSLAATLENLNADISFKNVFIIGVALLGFWRICFYGDFLFLLLNITGLLQLK